MRRLTIRAMGPRDARLTFVGGDGGGKARGGTYVLRIRVHRPLVVVFGRFDGGRPIALDGGEYAYVGSALACDGPSCLARRLVRHATRLGSNPPHSIRALMLAEFPRAGLCDADDSLPPVGPKRPRWNVDHLLDERCAHLVGAYLLRTPTRVEGRLGRLLMSDPAAVEFASGLGANDIPGNTHLLRIDAGKAWWRGLPGRLERLLLVEAIRELHCEVMAQRQSGHPPEHATRARVGRPATDGRRGLVHSRRAGERGRV